MAHHLWAAGTPFRLHVCAQDAGAVPFKDELATLPFAEAIEVHLDACPGRTSLAPASALGPWEAGTELYVCGPGGFMDWVSGRANELGWPLDTVHRESFSAPVYDITDSRPFDVVLARRDITLHMPAGRQILDVLAEHEIVVPWACSQGVCGTCITPVLERRTRAPRRRALPRGARGQHRHVPVRLPSQVRPDRAGPVDQIFRMTRRTVWATGPYGG